MQSIPQPAERSIIGPPLITCVGPDGTQTPQTELWYGPSEAIDPTDAMAWPESNEVDGWYWELDDLAEVAEMESAAAEAMADAADGTRLWAEWLIESSLPALSGGAPEPFEPSAADWEDYRRHFDAIDRERCRGDEDAMLAGLAVG